MRKVKTSCFIAAGAIVLVSLMISFLWAQAAVPVGVFESHVDVGTVLHPGSVEFDSTKRTYTISGSGENMWSTADAFQFAWKKMSGDVTADRRHPVPDQDRQRA